MHTPTTTQEILNKNNEIINSNIITKNRKAIRSIKKSPIIFTKLLLFLFVCFTSCLLFINFSKLTFNVLDSIVACFKLGDVSPSSHLDIVCLATPISSANSSCE